jgi:predicted nucleic acid-binding protein
MILVDTSVWIDFFKAQTTSQVILLEQSIKDNKDICICGVILSEVLQGIRNERQYKLTKSYFNSLIFLPMNYTTFIKSAEIYRYLRRNGVTIRKPIDCMIAAVSIQNNILLLHNDKDFGSIEKYSDLKVLTS